MRKIINEREMQEKASIIDKLYFTGEKQSVEAMQVYLLSSFQTVNREMDKLQLTFNKMAKVMFVSRIIST